MLCSQLVYTHLEGSTETERFLPFSLFSFSPITVSHYDTWDCTTFCVVHGLSADPDGSSIPCGQNSCYHGGVCSSNVSESYCQCPSYYSGPNCTEFSGKKCVEKVCIFMHAWVHLQLYVCKTGWRTTHGKKENWMKKQQLTRPEQATSRPGLVSCHFFTPFAFWLCVVL